jgi:hypothetical protein
LRRGERLDALQIPVRGYLGQIPGGAGRVAQFLSMAAFPASSQAFASFRLGAYVGKRLPDNHGYRATSPTMARCHLRERRHDDAVRFPVIRQLRARGRNRPSRMCCPGTRSPALSIVHLAADGMTMELDR